MNKSAYHILRVGTAITFLWIGILILQDPTAWSGYLMPWAYDLIPVPVEKAMIGTAMLDIVVGFLMLIDVWTWIAALVGTIHILIVLITSGITSITVRDIGLLASTIALSLTAASHHRTRKN